MNKNNKYNILIYLDLVAAILFPVIAVFQVEEYSANIVNGLFLILILAIMTGLLLPNIMVSWLIILLTTIAAGFLVLGYVVIPTEAKWLLVVAFSGSFSDRGRAFNGVALLCPRLAFY